MHAQSHSRCISTHQTLIKRAWKRFGNAERGMFAL